MRKILHIETHSKCLGSHAGVNLDFGIERK